MEAAEFLNAGFCRAGNPQLESKSGEHFIVEDLLDFSNEDDDHLVIETAAGDDGTYDHAACNYTDSSTVTAFDSCNSSFSSSDQHLSSKIPSRSYADDLCLPYDELAELEWLSNFVEESFSSQDFQKLQLSSGTNADNSDISESGEFPVSKSRNNPIFRQDVSVPGKARSKRSRAAPCNWSSRLLVVSPATSSSESDAAVNSGKKSTSKKKEATTAAASGGDGRKCLHCATDKTPQWRTGPMGPKTLCNACGVRYKSGRLMPEYRPAASPTFVLTKHSNCHRKVLELRRQKELLQQQQFLHPNAAFDVVGGDEYLIHAPFSKANLMIGGAKKMDFW